MRLLNKFLRVIIFTSGCSKQTKAWMPSILHSETLLKTATTAQHV